MAQTGRIQDSANVAGKNNAKGDSAKDHAYLYVSFNSGQSSLTFPLAINGKFICKLPNHSRLRYIIFTPGEANVCRQVKRGEPGPCRNLMIIPGQMYGIRITVKNEQSFDPDKRFGIEVFDGPEADRFIRTEFYSFAPFPEDDLFLSEKSLE